MPDYHLFRMLLWIQRFLSSSEVDTRQNHVWFATHPTPLRYSSSVPKCNIQIFERLLYLFHVCRNLNSYSTKEHLVRLSFMKQWIWILCCAQHMLRRCESTMAQQHSGQSDLERDFFSRSDSSLWGSSIGSLSMKQYFKFHHIS